MIERRLSDEEIEEIRAEFVGEVFVQLTQQEFDALVDELRELRAASSTQKGNQ